MGSLSLAFGRFSALFVLTALAFGRFSALFVLNASVALPFANVGRKAASCTTGFLVEAAWCARVLVETFTTLEGAE